MSITADTAQQMNKCTLTKQRLKEAYLAEVLYIPFPHLQTSMVYIFRTLNTNFKLYCVFETVL